MSTPKTIFSLAYVDDDPASLDPALAMAARSGAYLAIALIGIVPPLPVDIYGGGPLDWWTRDNEEGMARLKEAGGKLRERLSRQGVAGEVALKHIGDESVMSVAATHARYADLSLGVPKARRDGRIWDAAVPGLLLHSGRPMLLPAQDKVPSLEAERVVVAWNASKEAATAVYAAIDVLKKASAVHVTVVDPLAAEGWLGEEPGNDVGGYLARHAIPVVVDRLPSEGRGIARTILRHADDIEADFVVAGAYGHSRLREYVFGGVTLELMEEADRAIFLAH